MTKLVVALAVIAAALTACSSAEDATGDETVTVKTVDGTRCIFWKPSDSTVRGSQMECDFR
ncbi:hypothetical protein SEA_STEPHIG9_67 [Mycobacterium phage Stephig9]|uniref:Lipoprotein n=1 Tax=Mycobacterium phage Stephig9 TaxID=2591224 RepID=A0A514DHD4_9CAUD|nr:hypothetical protein SEA_STEPHIG9_67 [Mycobacterium phage Stephig9]